MKREGVKLKLVLVGVILLLLGWSWGQGNKQEVVKTIGQGVGLTETVKEQNVSKIGVMADTHLDWDSFKKALKLAKSRGEEMVIIDGDLTSVGSEAELKAAKKVLEESGIKYLAVPGNHDLWVGDRIKADLFGKYFGEEYGAVKLEGVKLILVNNGGAGGLGEKQKQWLEGELKECRQIRCIAVMHMPIKHNFSTHVMGEDSREVTKEAEKLWQELKESGVKEILAGHLHYSGSYEIEGIRTYVVGAITAERNNQTPRFTEFNISALAVNSEVLVLEEHDENSGN
jgi:predicted phosphodiesterase